jgi:hypothetical protein
MLIILDPSWARCFWWYLRSHSKWLKIEMVAAATSRAIIIQLRKMFTIYGLPELLVSDNGSVLVSKEFKDFLKGNRIHHVTSAPYHPSSNGLADGSVLAFKKGMKKGMDNDLQRQLSSLLFHHRTTPHTTTGVSPAELMITTGEDKIGSHASRCRSTVVRKQEKQKEIGIYPPKRKASLCRCDMCTCEV